MSQITILNHTDNSELVRVAIYKKPTNEILLETVAWQIVAPPPGGQTVVPTLEEYQVYAEYSLDPNNPDPSSPKAAVNQTNKVSFPETTARLQILADTSGDKSVGICIKQVFTGLVANEVLLENNCGIGVVSHIQRDNLDIFAPQPLWAGAVRTENVLSTFYLAVVGQFVTPGSQLIGEDIQPTETPILEGGTATVTGSMWKGYSITTSP